MTWIEISVDAIHRVFRCHACKRLAVTPLHIARPFGDCVCRST